MNKIRLSTGQKFDLIGSGYAKNAYNNTISVVFTSDLDIAAVQAAFKDEDAISNMEIILPDGTTKESLTDCIALQSISQDSMSKYTVTLTTDKALLQKRLKAAQEALAYLDEVIDALSDTIVYISVPMEGGE